MESNMVRFINNEISYVKFRVEGAYTFKPRGNFIWLKKKYGLIFIIKNV